MTGSQREFSFDLPLIARAIVDALQVALEQVMPDIMHDNNLLERNGYGQFRWNPIIAQLRDKCQHIGWLEMDICQRGAWKAPVLFHHSSGNIFTLMTEETFKTIQHRKDKGKHYLCGAAHFNGELEAQYEQLELSLPGVHSDLAECVYRSQEQLARAVHAEVSEIRGHILVLFDSYDDRLLSVRAVRLTHSLEISTEEERWSHFIDMPYATDTAVIPIQNDMEVEEDLVELL